MADLIDTAAIAVLAGCKEGSVRQWKSQYTNFPKPAFRKPGESGGAPTSFYDKTEVIAFLAQRKLRPKKIDRQPTLDMALARQFISRGIYEA